MDNAITFNASFPPIPTAITVGGEEIKLKLLVPSSNLGEIMLLMTKMNKPLKITVEVMP